MLRLNDNTQKIVKQILPHIHNVVTGPCAMSEVWSDIVCPLDVYQVVSPDVCNSLCLSQTYNRMECWATRQYDRSRCILMYDVDPMSCKRNHFTSRRDSITFKSCFNGGSFFIYLFINLTRFFVLSKTKSMLKEQYIRTLYQFDRRFSSIASQCTYSSELTKTSMPHCMESFRE